MKYQNIIFDLDGVICHTDAYHYQAWKALADKLGIYFDEEINNQLRGVSRMESLNIVLRNYDGVMTDSEKTGYAEEKNNIYKELLKKMSPADLSCEVKDTLCALREKGIKLAIGSSSKNARFILERIGLGDFFDEISDGNNISKSKPDPEVFFKGSTDVRCTAERVPGSGRCSGRNSGSDRRRYGFRSDRRCDKIRPSNLEIRVLFGFVKNRRIEK